MREHDQITDQIWLGGRITRREWQRLHGLGISVVISLQEEERDDFGGLDPEAELWLPAPDMEMPTLDQMWMACAVLHQSVLLGRQVVIHCYWGVGRSPMTLAAYFVTQGWEAGDAVDHITSRRPVVKPNEGQLAQLTAFAERWRRGGFPALPGAGDEVIERR